MVTRGNKGDAGGITPIMALGRGGDSGVLLPAAPKALE